MTSYRYAEYTLALREPAVLTSLGGDPNSSTTLPFVPGSAVRGAAAASLVRTGDQEQTQEVSEIFRKVVLDGSVRFLNAYPCARSERSLPTPISLQRDKLTDQNATTIEAMDTAAYDGQPGPGHDLEGQWPEGRTIRVEAPFVTMSGGQLGLVDSETSSRIHNQRDRQKGRAWKEKKGSFERERGAIFSYESLDSGHRFSGLLEVKGSSVEECQSLLARTKAALGSRILVGRSRHAEYGGGATITWGRVKSREVEGPRLLNRDLGPREEFCVLLTSPYVGRNPESGQIDPSWLVVELAQKLGNRARWIRQRQRFEAFGGFNRKWRLELPQVLCAAAGSVLVFSANEGIKLNDILLIEHEGIGERKTEGFGRLVFLDKPTQKINLTPCAADSSAEAPTGEAPELVRSMEGRILEAAIGWEIEDLASDLAQSAKDLPSSSLLGRLRMPLRGDPNAALQTLQEWLDVNGRGVGKLRRPAMDKLDECRLICEGQEVRLSGWLRDMSTGDAQRIGSLLRFDTVAQQKHIVSRDSALAVLRTNYKPYAVRLIDTVLASLSLRNRQEGGQ